MNTPHTDIIKTGWISHCPAFVQPYLFLMRLDRPIGTWLLLLPAWWSIAAASGGILDLSHHHILLFIFFACGAIILRGAGCVINDLWDRNLDKQVERTKNRPLAAGTVSPHQAIIFTLILLGIGLIILLQLKPAAIILGIISLIPVILYPLAKRVTWYPQAVLGLTFNMGALMGWAAVTNTIGLPAILMYAAGFFWTLGYDTIYAHQDKADDGIVGIKSTALKFGQQSHIYIATFYIISAALIFTTGVVTDKGPVFFCAWMLLCAHFMWQLRKADFDNPALCLKLFRSNRDVGLIILCACLSV